ncbi:carbonyl reductase [NADPH] 1-like [Babylonia areolata]|uniref:carbonyl reductase [NADPH] 1-like n=1 Tax=Babylonia areolata TaxID=304850 RepID=UPI003FD1A3A3
MASVTKVAVVTGGNRGLGLEIVRSLCKKFDGDVILAARTEKDGWEAVKQLRRESEVTALFHQLDVCNPTSIQALAAFLKKTYGGLDILVNNAGIMFKTDSPEPLSAQVQKTLAVNFWGCLDCCKVLFPCLRPGARVVNVTSMYCRSTLRDCSPTLRARFTDPALTIGQLESLMTHYQRCANSGTCHVNGWPTFAYGVSKIGVTMMSAIQQREIAKDRERRDIVINACCPGWCRTELGGSRAVKSAAQGADTPVYLALLPPGCTSPQGALVSDRTVHSFG